MRLHEGLLGPVKLAISCNLEAAAEGAALLESTLFAVPHLQRPREVHLQYTPLDFTAFGVGILGLG